MIKEIHIDYTEHKKIIDYYYDLGLGQSLMSESEYMSHGQRLLDACLSQNTLSEIVSTLKNAYQTPVMVIRGMPLSANLPPTPTVNGEVDDPSLNLNYLIDFGLYGVSGIAPVAYAGENNNKLIRHVVPNEQAISEVSSQGSRFAFGMHVDNPHLPLDNEEIKGSLSGCPSFLLLHCLRSNVTVPTKVLFLDEAAAKLPKFVIQGLKKPIFDVLKPDSFGENQEIVSPLCLLGHTNNGYMLSRMDKKFARANTEEAQFYFDIFLSAIEDESLHHKIVLTPGDLVILHNQRTLHARDAFQPRFNGVDRWLTRLYGLTERSRLRQVDQVEWLGFA